MVMANEQTIALIAAAQEIAANGGVVPADLRCQYPSKRCSNVRTTKRGGGLHRLCSFHRQRANKNQWLVDQRRRQRRDSPVSSPKAASVCSSPKSTPSSPTSADAVASIMSTLDVLDSDTICAPLCDQDLHILQALLFDDECDVAEVSTTASLNWTVYA